MSGNSRGLLFSNPPRLVAHRGASHDAPENTLAAIDLAWRQGFTAVEIDIRFTADGKIVVIHDAHTARVSDRRLDVATSTFADLRMLDVGAFKGDAFVGERIPLLEEVLEQMPDGTTILIEIKCGTEVLPRLAESVRTARLAPEQVCLIAFDAAVLDAAGLALPGHARLLLGSLEDDTPNAVDKWIGTCRAHAFTGADLHFSVPASAKTVARFHNAEQQICTWTVDDPEIARAQAAAGVDMITTNRPAWIAGHL